MIMKRASTFTDDAIAGAVTGAVTRIMTAPFDVLKIRFQLQNTVGAAETAKYRTMFQAFSTIIREEGILALWNGNLSATYLWVTYAVVQFSVYGFLKRLFEDASVPFSSISSLDSTQSINNTSSESKSNIHTRDYNSKRIFSLWKALLLFLAGAGAGITATVCTYPFDIMRTQFVVQGKVKVYDGMSSFIKHTYRSQGPAGFFVGLTPAVVGIAPYMGLNFALFEAFKNIAHSPLLRLPNGGNGETRTSDKPAKKIASLLKNGLSGGLAGGISKLVVYPLDTVKKRLQVQTLANTMSVTGPVFAMPKYTGIVDCMQVIHSNEGLKGFYKGIVPTLYKSVVSTAIAFAIYETTKEMLVDRKEKMS